MSADKLTPAGGTLMEVLAFTASETRSLADANGVLGEPVVIDGVTVIPVSKVSVGFAGGGADIKSDKKSQSPAGVGARVTLTPVTFLVFKEGRVQQITVAPQEKDTVVDLAKMAVAKFKEWTRK
ncbi:MAG: sporulation protein YtfJ [Clostridia bacterium]|nr:sporulation protein YtfJ [Clostridia bacterium]